MEQRTTLSIEKEINPNLCQNVDFYNEVRLFSGENDYRLPLI